MSDSQTLQSRLPELREDLLTEAQRTVLQRLEAKRGRVPTPYRIWIQSPELAEPLMELGTVLSKSTSFSKREYELAILLMARHWQAEYVFEAHTREALAAGLSGAAIAEIRAELTPTFLDARARNICRIINGFVNSAPPGDEAFHEALESLGHRGLAELLALCGYFTSVCLAMKVYRVPS